MCATLVEDPKTFDLMGKSQMFPVLLYVYMVGILKLPDDGEKIFSRQSIYIVRKM
jgi:hypothetical protein